MPPASGVAYSMDDALVTLRLPAAELADVVRAATLSSAQFTGLSARAIEVPLMERVADGHIAVGGGVAIPHAAVEGLDRLHIGLIITSRPLPVPDAPDGDPVDLFFFILAPLGAHVEHLHAVATVARYVRSPALCSALRSAGSVADVLRALQLAAAAASVASASPTPQPLPVAPGSEGLHLLLVEIEGETAVDRLVVDLASHAFDDALVMDGQGLGDFATRSLPLFAGFRDLFGDPGGRRLIMLTARGERLELAVRLVRRACREARAQAGRVVSLPVQEAWRWTPEPPGDQGH